MTLMTSLTFAWFVVNISEIVAAVRNGSNVRCANIGPMKCAHLESLHMSVRTVNLMLILTDVNSIR